MSNRTWDTRGNVHIFHLTLANSFWLKRLAFHTRDWLRTGAFRVWHAHAAFDLNDLRLVLSQLEYDCRISRLTLTCGSHDLRLIRATGVSLQQLALNAATRLFPRMQSVHRYKLRPSAAYLKHQKGPLRPCKTVTSKKHMSYTCNKKHALSSNIKLCTLSTMCLRRLLSCNKKSYIPLHVCLT